MTSSPIEPFLRRKPKAVKKEVNSELLEIYASFLLMVVAVFIFGVSVLGWGTQKANADETVSASQVHSVYGACVFLKSHPGSITNSSELPC